MSSSKSRADTSNEVTQTSENVNVQDVEGITIADNDGNIRIVQTDHNAIGDASRLAQGAVDAAESINADSLDFAARISSGAMGSVERGFTRAQDSAYDFAGSALDFVGTAVQKTQDTIGAAVGAILQIGKEQNTSTDQRVGDIAAQSQKNMLIAVGILGVAVLAFTLYKGR